MRELNHDEIDFLNFIHQELEKLDKETFGFKDEATMRESVVRLRHLLHRTESNLSTLYNIFQTELFITPETITFLYTSNDTKSPACYHVEFNAKLNEESLKTYNSQNNKPDRFTLAYPMIGFDRERTIFENDSPMRLDSYLDLPIIGIEDTLITRWQLISFLANKKGLAHYSEKRDRKWQKKLDKIWRHKTTLRKKDTPEFIRSIYEIAQRLANEVMNIPKLKEIRVNLEEIAIQTKNF